MQSARKFYAQTDKETMGERSFVICLSLIETIFSVLIVPPRQRETIRAIIRAIRTETRDAESFYKCNAFMVGRALNECSDKTVEALTQAGRRAINELTDWQESTGLNFIRYAPGGRDKFGKNFDSRAALPILGFAVQVHTTAFSKFVNPPDYEIENAVMHHKPMLMQGSARIERFNRSTYWKKKRDDRQQATFARTKKRAEAAIIAFHQQGGDVAQLTAPVIAKQQPPALQTSEILRGDRIVAPQNFKNSAIVTTPPPKADLKLVSNTMGNSNEIASLDILRDGEIIFSVNIPEASLDAFEDLCNTFASSVAGADFVDTHVVPCLSNSMGTAPPGNGLSEPIAVLDSNWPADEQTARILDANLCMDSMVEAGAVGFSVTILDSSQDKKISFTAYDPEKLKTRLPGMLAIADDQRQCVIVRPVLHNAENSLVQLDDMTEAQARDLAPYSFLVLETSPKNFQCWIAIKAGTKEDSRRLREGCAADLSASSATRLPGSYNFKPKYAAAPPLVRIERVNFNRVCTVQELENAKLMSDKKTAPRPVPHGPQSDFFPVQRAVWPSYERCLNDAPNSRSHEGKDRSYADFNFCVLSASRGFEFDAIVAKLREVSEKARDSKSEYVLSTVRNAIKRVRAEANK